MFLRFIDGLLQRLNRQRGGVMFSRRQTADGFHNVVSGQLTRFFHIHSFQHFGKRRTARQRGWTTIGKKSRCFDPTVFYAKTQSQTIAANRIRCFGNGVCLWQLAGVAWLREMIFEDF
jgi:hypothetical protein